MSLVRSLPVLTDPIRLSKHLIEAHDRPAGKVDHPGVLAADLRRSHEVIHRGLFPWQHKRPHTHERSLG